jgi:hypothetical protein
MPVTIVNILDCDIPRPRKIELMGTQEFAILKRKALSIFKSSAQLK